MRRVVATCVLTLLVMTVLAQEPSVPLPDESAGTDQIVRTLLEAFDRVDILALGEAHQRKVDSDLRIALVRHPDFARKVRTVVIEFGSTAAQGTLDRYISGDTVSPAQLAQVWKTTTQAGNGVWDHPIYAEFLAAIRDVNAKLPAAGRIRVFGGDPGPGDTRSRDGAAVAVLKEQVLDRRGKALVVYGAAHFYRTEGDASPFLTAVGGGIAKTLEARYPGRTFVVIPVGGPENTPPIAGFPRADYQRFERAVKTTVRPVLVSLQRAPFRDFRAEEFIGHGLLNCLGPGGCVSAFKGSTLTLGQMADAAVYFGQAAGRPNARDAR